MEHFHCEFACPELDSGGGQNLEKLLNPHQFHDPAGDIPVLDVQVAVGVPVRTVRAAEDAFDPVFLRDVEIAPLFGIGIVPKHRHDRVALVQDHQSSVQVRHRDIVALNRDRSGHSQSSDDFFDEFAVKRVMQQTPFRLMIAVANQQARWIVARVQRHPVGGIELLQSVSFGPKVHHVLSILVVLENMITGVTIGQKDITVGSHRDRGRIEFDRTQF